MADGKLVSDVMDPEAQCIESSHPLMAAKQRMMGDMRVKSLIVTEEGRPIGMVRYNDIDRDAGAGMTVSDVTVRGVPAATAEQTLEELTGVMTQYDVDRLPVIDAEGCLVGELPRAALTLTEIAGDEAALMEQTLAEAQANDQSPALDVRKDMNVVGGDGAKIGKVKEIMADAASGSLTHVIVHTGILFGKDKSVPADLVDRVEGEDVYLKIDKQDLNMLPDLAAEA